MFLSLGNAILIHGFASTPTALAAIIPAKDAVDVLIDTVVEFQIQNAPDIDIHSIAVTIGGELAFANGESQPGWRGVANLDGATVDVMLRGVRPFHLRQRVDVEVTWDGGSGSYAFTTVDDLNCWHGALTNFEGLLLRPLPLTNLELLRARLLYASTTSRTPEASARSVVQMAFDTEVGVVLRRLVILANEIFSSRVCERRTYIEIDLDLTAYYFLIDQALDELTQDQRIPEAYMRMYRGYVKGRYPRYRVAGIAAMLCLASHYYLGAGP